MVKAIFFDVDGTLVSHKTKQVSESTRKCIGQLREKGIRLYLCTGRHIKELEKLPVGDMKFDGYVTINGQLCLDGKKNYLYGTPFSEEASRKLGILFREKQFPLVLVEEKSLYLNFVNEAAREALQEVSTPVPPIAEYGGRPIYQATTFFKRQEEKQLEEVMPSDCKLLRWSEHGVDLVSARGGKVAGMKYILDMLGLTPKEILAFGDADNDIEMLKFAGTGIAMGNAKEAVKLAADYITEDIDENGIEKALKYFGLI